MINNTRIVDDIIRQLREKLGQRGLGDNIEPLLRSAAEAALAPLELVSRSEFDAQAAKLARAEQQLQELEQQLQVLLARSEPH